VKGNTATPQRRNSATPKRRNSAKPQRRNSATPKRRNSATLQHELLWKQHHIAEKLPILAMLYTHHNITDF